MTKIEYLKALSEHHNLQSKVRKNQFPKREDQKNRGRWNIRIVMKLNRGRDRVVQSARIKYGKSMLERTIQYFHPMELFYDLVWRTEKDAATLNVNTREYVTEQTKAVAAKL